MIGFLRAYSFLLLALFAGQLRAAITVSPWASIFRGIDFATGEADANEVRLQKVQALRVDLQEPAIEFFSTPSNGDEPEETFGQTTTTFVNTYSVKVGVNANFFSPVSTVPNEPRQLSGLAISQGTIVSPAENGNEMLLITRSNVASIVSTAPASLSNIWTAVAGSDIILVNGTPQLAGCTTSFCNQNPRTAVGISQDGRYLFMMTIDGRQSGYSDGATLYETGQWLQRFGAWNGLNLDGGGSTAMSKIENGTAILLNRPSGGVQRVNGNHIGVFASNLPPVILSQPSNQTVIFGQSTTLSVFAGGTTPLRYQWRFNGTNISSATKTNFTRSPAQFSHAGNYTVVITNGSGSITSAVATLNVHYSLTTTEGFGGMIVRSPDQPSFVPDSVVTLTAVPDPGFVFTGWSGDDTSTSNPLTVTMTTNKNFTANFFGQVADVILDNTNANVSFSGTWQTGVTAAGRYGNDYRFALTVASALSSNATYRPNITTPGKYNVYLWYPQGGNRSTNAPWLISFNGGSVVMPVNQRTNGGNWFQIGEAKDFSRGTNAFVRLSNDTGASGSVVIADAVRFEFLHPPIFIGSPQNQAVYPGQTATFSATVFGAAPLNYQWRFNGTNIIGATQTSLSLSNVIAADAGSYSLVVGNSIATNTSSVALLTVLSPPAPPQFQPPAMLNGQLELSFSAEPYIFYTLEASTNLMDWVQIAILMNSTGTIQFVDPDATSRPQRFYRTRWSP